MFGLSWMDRLLCRPMPVPRRAIHFCSSWCSLSAKAATSLDSAFGCCRSFVAQHLRVELRFVFGRHEIWARDVTLILMRDHELRMHWRHYSAAYRALAFHA
jgi:hypothetical protein